jgi:hypothetical protein
VRGPYRCREWWIFGITLHVGVALVFFLGLRQANADINRLGIVVSTEALAVVTV